MWHSLSYATRCLAARDPDVNFVHGLHPYTDFDASAHPERIKYLSGVCRVSKHWKDVAYSSPRLWSLVAVDWIDGGASASDLPYQAERRQLEKAKSASLDIILRNTSALPTDSEFFDPGFWEFWSLLTSRCDQWRTLRIDGVVVDSMDTMLRLLPPCLPNLLEARIGMEASHPLPPVISAPRLRHYELGSRYLPFKDASALEYLYKYRELNEMIPFLKICPTIRTLHFDQATYHHPYPTDVAHLPALEEVVFTDSFFAHVDHTLRTILDAPNVRTLTFKSFPPLITVPITPLIVPSLERIQMNGASVETTRSLRQLLGMLPAPKVGISFLPIPWTRRGVRQTDFLEADDDVKWMEDMGMDVVWQEGDARPGRFRSWNEVREYFGGDL